jgi:hypothetical protein
MMLKFKASDSSFLGSAMYSLAAIRKIQREIDDCPRPAAVRRIERMRLGAGQNANAMIRDGAGPRLSSQTYLTLKSDSN